MLTYGLVWDMFKLWQSKGIEYKEKNFCHSQEQLFNFLTNGFLSRYLFLQPEELAAFSKLVQEKGAWPSKEEIVQLVELVLADNMQGLEYDTPILPQEDEDYDGYVQRLGKSLYPNKDGDWYYRNALNIRLVYESGYCCRHCQGICPYGNRMVGMVSKQDDRLLIKRASGLCRRFKRFRDDTGVGLGDSEKKADADIEKREDNREVGKENGQFAVDTTNYAKGDYPMEALQ